MPFAETPVQIIKGSIRVFILACFMENAVRDGLISPKSLREQIRLDEGGRGVDFRKTYADDELKAEARNLTVITLGTTAMSTNKAIEVVYGREFDAADTSPEGSARVLLYQIRCAFAHDPLNPIWAPTPRFSHHYRVTVRVNRPTGELVTERLIEFHPPSLNGSHLIPDHIGGLGGYLGLLHYFLAKVEAHARGNEPYLPLSPEES
jgi:hypothetical protein